MTEKLQQLSKDALATAGDNLEQLIKRGEKLNQMEEDAQSLYYLSREVLYDAKNLDWLAFWRKYKLWIIVYGTIAAYVVYRIV